MPRLALPCLLLLLSLSTASTSGTRAGAAAAQPEPAPAFSTEQEWIVSEIVTAIDGVARGTGAQGRVTAVQTDPAPADAPAVAFQVAMTSGVERIPVVEHIWSPEMYAPFAARRLGAQKSSDSTDYAARVDLAGGLPSLILTAARLSTVLSGNLTSAPAHEAAALVLSALALREGEGILGDVRSQLSRASAHLAVAQALRAGGAEGRDATLARAAVAVLAGRQRDAMQIVATLEGHAADDVERSWCRALRSRITGDWRARPPASASRLEQYEHARALRRHANDDAFLDYLDSLDAQEGAREIEWQRVAYSKRPNVELGNTFAPSGEAAEIAAATIFWSAMHDGAEPPADLSTLLGARPALTPVRRVDGRLQVAVLDWGRLAAFHQRSLGQAVILSSWTFANLGDDDAGNRLPETVRTSYGRLLLYPVLARWVARTEAQYRQSLLEARPLVDGMPHIVTAGAWNVLLEKPSFARTAAAFPFEHLWFAPYVPTGTVYDVDGRSLRPGCRRPPSIAQARRWSQDAPYAYWVRWSTEWYAVPGRPTEADVARALGPLLDYDRAALRHMFEHLHLPLERQIVYARRLCGVMPSQCDDLAVRLLVSGRETDAAAAYDRWVDGTRDSVTVANGAAWLVRYHAARGNLTRAGEVAQAAAATGANAGLEVLAHLLDRTGAYPEAEQLYRRIAARYDNTRPLGAFQLRQAARAKDPAQEASAMELLRADLPGGMERLVMHALDPRPKNGVAFGTFGPRPAALGVRASDVLVGMDGWRIRSAAHYWVATRLSHDDRATLVVWRDGRYVELRVTIPERWLGVEILDYRPPAGTE